jgi:hypothetical protein
MADNNSLDNLRQQREALSRKMGELDALISAAEERHPPASRRADVREDVARASVRPIREVVLDALEDLDWLTYSRELAQFCAAWGGRTIQPERFGSLANDEVKSFTRSLDGGSPRPMWLCFGLTHDRHQPIKRLWGRSDWPLERRIVAPSSGRVQHLKLTAKLCEMAQRTGAADAEMLRIIAADHARDLPGVRVLRGKFDLEAWHNSARALLDELEPRDAEARKVSAKRLRDRGPLVQLFGVPDAEETEQPIPRSQRRRG